MWWWIALLVIVVLIGYGLWRAARAADSVEDDSKYLFEGGSKVPFGTKFVRIFGGYGDKGE